MGNGLVRKICSRCPEPYRPAPAVAARLGLVDPRGEPLEIARGRGCRSCSQSGYLGREVVAETLIMTPEIRELILKRAPERDLEEVACQQGMKTLREQGLLKVAARITTLEEVFRTTIGGVVEE